MPGLVIFGAQWGDEGKGKVVDTFCDRARACARFNGGGNAGHTLVVGGRKIVLKHLPSCLLHDDCLAVVSNGVVVNPEVLLQELQELEAMGHPVTPKNLIISPICATVLPHHRAYEARMEQLLGNNAIGTTKRGIGPVYADRAMRVVLRLGDLLHPEIVKERIALKQREYAGLNIEVDWAAEEKLALEWGQKLAPFLGNAAQVLRKINNEGGNIILEGAQGALLDIDFGTYPFVTASSTTGSFAPAGSGLPPKAITSVMAVSKAYCTRVGAGPFPTELDGELASFFQKKGNEFGSTTGRPRRVGWLDIASLRDVVQATGTDYLTLTKLDVLTGLDKIKVCMSYKLDGKTLQAPPEDSTLWSKLEPQYETLPGWDSFPTSITSLEQLPANARDYITFIEREAGVKLAMLSIGPDREQGLVINPILK